MDDGTPNLEVGFTIDTGGSFDELKRLVAFMETAEFKTLKSAKEIERATSGMVKVNSTAATRELATLARETAKAEKSGEGMVKQMQRQIEVYGKTASEIRNLRAEQRALAVESTGNTVLAGEIRALNTQLNALERGTGGVTNAAVKNRQAMQGASYQVQDFFTQVSMGANPLNAFAVQGAQLAGQFSNVEGKAGNVARFFMGPWGLAITAGLLVLGPFVAKLFESNNAFDDAVNKLRKDAEATETNRRAKEAFARTLEGVIDAVRRQNEEFEKSIQTQRDMAVQGAATARVQQAHYERDAKAVAAQLDAAKTAAQVARDLANMPGADPTSSAMSIARAESEIVRLTAKLKAAQVQVAEVVRAVRQADAGLAMNAAKTATDKIGSINAAFDQQASDAIRGAVATAKSQEDITVALTKQLTQIEINRQAAIKAEEDKQKAATETVRQMGRNIDLVEARRIAQGVGGTVTSDHRTRQEQERLWAKYQAYKAGTGPWAAVAARPGTSNHELDQAIDVAKTRGMTLKKLVDAFQAAGVRVVEKLDEGSHFHIAWAKVGDAARQATEARTEAERAIAEQKRIYDASVKAANDYVAAQKKAADQSGLTAKEIRAYADQVAIAKAPTDALKQAIRDAAKEREASFSKQSDADFQTNVIKPLQDELALYGKVGPARAAVALELEREAFIAKNLGDGVDVATQRWKEYYAAKMALANKDDSAQREADALQRINGELDQMIGKLGNMGGIGGAVGGLLGIFSGRTGAVGGSLGDLLNITVRDNKGLAVTLGEQLSKVFDKSGTFGKTMKSLLQGAGTGMLAGEAVFGRQSTIEKLGSSIGGSIGGKVGEKVLGKALGKLGDFAGPIGSIVGGLLGGALGGLLTSVKWGRATLTSGGVADGGGNDGASQKAAMAAGSGIFKNLQDLASQLGGSLGDFGSISVGVRHGDYRVNTGGTSLKKKRGAVDFDDDAEAAALYAMQQAINRGAIQGIRVATNTLLKSSDDLQANLQKALRFEGVFSDLKAATDPIGAELASLNKEFDQLRDIFKQAGATAAEYADLEQLLVLRRQEVLNKEKDAVDDIKARIARVQGDEKAAVAIERARELRDAMTDSVRTELQRLYAIEDATAAQQKAAEEQATAAAAAKELQEAWKSVSDSIMDEVRRIRGLTEAGTPGGFAALLGQFNAATEKARAGDQDVAKSLPDLSKDLLTAAALVATSRQELNRIQAQTAASLEQTYGVIGALAKGAAATTDAVTQAATAQAATASAATNDNATETLTDRLEALTTEIAQMRAENTAGHAATAANTGKTAKILENVTPSGDAITVEAAA